MTCKPIVFTGITRDKFQRVRSRIRAQADVTIDGDNGTAAAEHYAAQWNYDEPAQTLTIQCTGKPFFISESTIAGKIRDLVEAS